MADPHPTAERKRRAGVLPSHENRLRPVGLSVDVALTKADLAAVSLLALPAAEIRLEVLDMQPVAVSELLLPMLADRLQHLGWAGKERLALPPIGTQPVEISRGDPTTLSRQLLMQPKTRVTPRELAQLHPENHVAGGTRRMQMHRIDDPHPTIDAAQHAHDRRDATPSTDEQQLGRQRVG